MNEEITANLNYEWAKTEITKELQTEANSFIRVGWIFKMVRDGKIETPYGSVTEFAEKEWNLGKDVVSRYMRINDHFSINGYSEKIAPQYGSFGYSKLAIMLTLPDEINEELTPDYSKSDIQAIKTEYDAEQKITPLELMTEPKAEQPDTDNDELLAMVVKQLNDEHPTPIELIHEIRKDTLVTSDEVKDAYRPGEDKTYIIRISGVGRYNVYAKEKGITIQNIRDMTRKSVEWEKWMDLVLEDEEKRKFTEVTKASPKNEKKPAKVEKSSVQKKAESAAKSEKAEEKEQKAEDMEKIVEPEDPEEIVEKVEGEVVEDDFINPPKSTVTDISQIAPIDGSAGDEDDNSADLAAGENDNSEDRTADNTDTGTAAGESDDVEDRAAGDEEVMLDTLNNLVSVTECFNIRERVQGMSSLYGYREDLDRVCEWIAQLHAVTNKLYAKLAARGK